MTNQENDKKLVNMDERKKRLRVFAFVGLAAAIAGVSILISIYSVKSYRKQFLSNYEYMQDGSLEEMKMQIQSSIQDSISDGKSRDEQIDKVVNDILGLNQAGNNRFWFFASKEQVYFYQNTQLTANKKGLSLDDLINQFGVNGGKNVDNFSRLINTNSDGSIVYSMSKGQDSYVAMIKNIQINEENYKLVYCVNLDYLYRQSGSNKICIIFAIIESVLLGVMVVLVIFVLSRYVKNKRNLEEYERELLRKNALVTELSSKVYPGSENDSYDEMREENTGIYTERFTNILLANLDVKKEVEVIVSVLEVKWKGKIKVIDLINKLQKLLGENYLIVRFEKNIVGILCFNTNEKEFSEKMNYAVSKIRTEYKKQRIVIEYGYDVGLKNDDSVYLMVEHAKDKLREAKK